MPLLCIEFRFVHLFDFENINMSNDVVYSCATCSKTFKGKQHYANKCVKLTEYAV